MSEENGGVDVSSTDLRSGASLALYNIKQFQKRAQVKVACGNPLVFYSQLIVEKVARNVMIFGHVIAASAMVLIALMLLSSGRIATNQVEPHPAMPREEVSHNLLNSGKKSSPISNESETPDYSRSRFPSASSIQSVAESVISTCACLSDEETTLVAFKDEKRDEPLLLLSDVCEMLLTTGKRKELPNEECEIIAQFPAKSWSTKHDSSNLYMIPKVDSKPLKLPDSFSFQQAFGSNSL